MGQSSVLERVDVRLDRIHLDPALLRASPQERRVVNTLGAGDDLLAADEDVVRVAVVGIRRVGHRVKRPSGGGVLGEHVKVGVVLLLDERAEDALVLGAEVPERVHAFDAVLLEHPDTFRKLESKRRPEVLQRLVRELLRDNFQFVREPLVEPVEHVQEQVIEHVQDLEVVLLDGHLHVQTREFAEVPVRV